MSGTDEAQKPNLLRIVLENIANDCWNAGRPEGAEMTVQEYAQEALALADGLPPPYPAWYARSIAPPS